MAPDLGRALPLVLDRRPAPSIARGAQQLRRQALPMVSPNCARRKIEIGRQEAALYVGFFRRPPLAALRNGTWSLLLRRQPPSCAHRV